MDSILSTTLRILEVAVAIGFLIFVHELGHFLVAKKVGIRVEVFSLGFGPRLLGFRRGDTDYRLSAIPLGGYVKMAGESPEEPHAAAEDEFCSKSVGARAAVISAGVVMNAIFAVLLFLLAFKIGVDMVPPVVGRVHPDSAAAAAGLQRGDEIVAIDGDRPLDFLDVGLAAAFAGEDGIEIRVRRGGELLPPIRIRPRRDLGMEFQRLGIEPIDEVAAVEPGGAAEAAGFRPGDWIVGVAGRPIDSLAAFDAAVRAHPGEPLPVEVVREGRAVSLTLVPAKVPARTFGIAISERPVVSAVPPGAPAAEAGLRPGDRVLAAGGVEPQDIAHLQRLIREAPPQKPIALTIERPGAGRLTIEVTPILDPVRGRPMIGVGLAAQIVGSVAPGSPAARAGIEPGMRIVAIEGQATGFAPGELDALATRRGEVETRFHLETPTGARRDVALVGALVPGKFQGDAQLSFRQASVTHSAPGILEPIALGFERTWIFMEQVALTIKGMFERRIDTSTLGGPIAIGQGAYAVASRGIGSLLYYLAVISINLAVFNILPVPILDGGHLVFLAIEKVRGAPVPATIQAAAQWVGLVLLLGLVVFVTRNDILRLLGS